MRVGHFWAVKRRWRRSVNVEVEEKESKTQKDKRDPVVVGVEVVEFQRTAYHCDCPSTPTFFVSVSRLKVPAFTEISYLNFFKNINIDIN